MYELPSNRVSGPGKASPLQHALRGALCMLAVTFFANSAVADDGPDLDPSIQAGMKQTDSFDNRQRGKPYSFPRALVYVNEQASEPDLIPAGTPAFTNVIDARTLKVIKRVPVEEKPHHFYKVPHKNKAYISHFGGTGVVEVLDLLSNEIVTKIPTSDGPRHLTFSKDGKYAWAANFDHNDVSLIDVEQDKTLWTAPVGRRPNYVEPAWSYVFSANLGESSLTVLNARTGAFVKTIPIGANPFNMSVSCDERTVMSANAGSNDVSFVDVGTLTEVARVSIMGPISTAQYDTNVRQRLNPRLSPDCKYLWVGNQAAGTFAVLDVEQRKLIAEIKSAEKGGGSDIIFFINSGPAKGLALGTNRYSEFTTLIDPTTFKALKRLPAAKGTHYVSLNQDFTEAYVSSRIGGAFSVYDLASMTEVARKTGFPPIDQAIYVSFERGIQASSVSESGAAK